MNRIDEISTKSKEMILSRLKDSYKIAGFESSNSIDPVEHVQTTNNPLEEMKQKMSDNKYIVHECDPSALEDTINEIVATLCRRCLTMATKYSFPRLIIHFGLLQ